MLLVVVSATSPAWSASWEMVVCADPSAAPYSERDRTGFDNRVAAELADALGAELRFLWLPDGRSRTLSRHLQAGACDVAVGVLDGQPGMLTTHAYYRTGYVFVSAADADHTIVSLDDPAIGDLVVGVQGDPRRPTPPAMGLARRGLLDTLRHPEIGAGERQAAVTFARAIDGGEIDLAILWGPLAAALAERARTALEIAPVTPEIDMPFIPMVASLSVGVRPYDVALRDGLDRALAERWDAVQTILADAAVPLLPLPRPLDPEGEVR